MANDLKYLVFTAVGTDRPGLVGRISKSLLDAGANIEDSRMAIFGGEFAVILLVAGPSEAIERVRKNQVGLEKDLGLSVFAKETTAAAPHGGYLLYRLRVTGVDQPGIVSKISTLLAGHQVNVASMESRLQFAPLSGTPMFVLRAELQIPSELALSELRKAIAAVCEDENLDFQLEGG